MDEMFAAIGASLGGSSSTTAAAWCSTSRKRASTAATCSSRPAASSFIEEGRDRIDTPSARPTVAITDAAPAVFGEQELRGAWPATRIRAARLLEKGVKSFCRVPLRSHDRVLGSLNVGRLRDAAFTDEDVELLGQVAQQIAIAVENGLAYRQIAELKEKLNKEKLYLEDEIRTEQNFDEIIGESAGAQRRCCSRSKSSRRPTRRC